MIRLVGGMYFDDALVESVGPSDTPGTTLVTMRSGHIHVVSGTPKDIARMVWSGESRCLAQLFADEGEA